NTTYRWPSSNVSGRRILGSKSDSAEDPPCIPPVSTMYPACIHHVSRHGSYTKLRRNKVSLPAGVTEVERRGREVVLSSAHGSFKTYQVSQK
ncbi:hypothetical protein AVEN_84512-1, partial [Araneus ventricosus]